MNNFITTEIKYISPSRTIETIEVRNLRMQKRLYLYNYEGYSFRVFLEIESLINFFKGKCESDFYFDSENSLDNFLETISIA